MAYISKDHRARRAVNFDLNIEALRENYSETNLRGAYKEIRSFFEKNGFFHRQGSGYCSKDTMTDAELFKTMQKMFKTFPWLDACSKKIDATDIGTIHDVKELLEKSNGKSAFQSKAGQEKKRSSKKRSVLQKLNDNKIQKYRLEKTIK